MTIIAPSIVTYDYTVDFGNTSYINLSFPFKTRITGIWFTADERMLRGNIGSGTIFQNSGRVLTLVAHKAKSPRVVLSQYDPPSDWAPFFGYADPEDQTDWVYGSEQFKPSMWLGIPEDAPVGTYKDSTTQFVGNVINYQQSYRSTTGYAPSLNDTHNPYWGNDGWNSDQFSANKYKTDMAIMNPDEVLNMFVMNSYGDWTDYDGTGTVTIHVAYTGVSATVEEEDPKTPWTAWWED